GGVAGWLAVRMRRQPVMRVLVTVVGVTVVLMIMIGIGHRVLLPEERSVTILAVSSWEEDPMANSNHDHEHDGHAHDGHEHTHDGLPPHSHGEPTGNAIEKIGFTRSQFLRMCLAGVAAGAAVPLGAQAQAQAPKASKPRTDSYDDPVAFNGPSAYRRF